MGLTYLSLGEKEKAITNLKSYTARVPGDENAARILDAAINGKFAARRVGRHLRDSVIGQIGLGAAGLGIVRLLRAHGARRILGTDRHEAALDRLAIQGGEPSTLEGVMANCDIVIATTGVRGLIRPELVRPGQIILALSNPDPETEPVTALERGAAFAADGKGINNVLAFPGLFRGALDARASGFDDAMLMAAAHAIAAMAPRDDLVPDSLDPRVHAAVAEAVRAAAAGEVLQGDAAV